MRAAGVGWGVRGGGVEQEEGERGEGGGCGVGGWGTV